MKKNELSLFNLEEIEDFSIQMNSLISIEEIYGKSKKSNGKNIIDLFSGAGGLSLGFQMAGYSIVAAVEKDEWASNTYLFNHKISNHFNKDITTVTGKELNPKNLKIDGIIGGPPCQGFSLSGNRDPNDPRNSLFMEFVRLVDEINPTFFLMENVPGILSMKTKDKNFVKDIIISEFEKLGYIVQVNKLNSADFGVPQLRNRVFFIGTKMPKNQNIEFDFNPTLIPSMRLTIENALSDLPEKGLDGDVHSEYKKNYSNDYQKWARFSSKGIINHVQMRHSDRLIERFKNIKQGESLADVGNEHMQRKRGDAGEISGKVYSQNNMRPYWKKPSPTIAASFQSNFIHPLFNRNYTAREAARIQSFPDYYEFKGKRTTMSWEKNLSQYQQIGNAVPPLLAKSIALVIYKTLFI